MKSSTKEHLASLLPLPAFQRIQADERKALGTKLRKIYEGDEDVTAGMIHRTLGLSTPAVRRLLREAGTTMRATTRYIHQNHKDQAKTVATVRERRNRKTGDLSDKVVQEAFAATLGVEIQRARESMTGLARVDFVQCLDITTGERTMLAYERGLRQMSVLKLMDVCEAIGIDPALLITLALQRFGRLLHLICLRVDLAAMSAESEPPPGMAWTRDWATNKMRRHPGLNVAKIQPAAIDELADIYDSDPVAVGEYFASFAPEWPLWSDEEEPYQ